MGITWTAGGPCGGANPTGILPFDEANYPIAGYEDNDPARLEAGYRAAIAIGTLGHIGHQSFDSAFPDMQRGMKKPPGS